MEKNVRLKLGERIKVLRKKNGLTQERLSEIADIDYKYIQRIEGKNPPAVRIDTLHKLAKTFKISISKLLEFE